jgi:hypothetical protein
VWTNEVAPERLAELFHHYHQALTTETLEKSGEGRGSWGTIPPQEKSRMVSAARLVLLELESLAHRSSSSRKYFAEPGEAEWGC